ncbi:hypothetical protein BC829DRAFT_435707 [Chytridium lagenaria]|nr:hypothetical protein BC829DRAFT_435707 [Chytridium lagenaria]
MASLFALTTGLLDQARMEIHNNLSTSSINATTAVDDIHPHPLYAANGSPPRRQRQPSSSSSPSSGTSTPTSSKLACSGCGHVLFSSIDDQRLHFRSDWHRYNQQRLLNNKLPISELEFEEQDEISSIEGSDDENDEPDTANLDAAEFGMANGSPFHFFRLPGAEDTKNPTVSLDGSDLEPVKRSARAMRVYRHIFSKSVVESGDNSKMLDELSLIQCELKRQPSAKNLETVKKIKKGDVEERSSKPVDVPVVKPNGPVWVILMLGSGHFAGAVFEAAFRGDAPDGTVLAHKTFHRYTTRKKQGGAQSSNDGSKGKANSAGAQLRRYNEQMLQQEIKDLLILWKPYLDASKLIFTRVPARSRRTVFFDDTLLSFKDDRIRSIPFSTRRPTLLELKRCYKELSTVKIVEVDLLPPSVESNKNLLDAPKPEKREKVVEKKPEEPALIDFVKRGKDELITAITSAEGFDSALLTGQFPDSNGTSLLHIAASHSQPTTVGLLLSLGCDPTVRESANKKRTPYDVSDDKDTRDAFRRAFAQDPAKWDWVDGAGVPSMLTPEMEERQREKEREKKRKQKEKQKALKEASSEKTLAAKVAKDEEEKKKKRRS